MDTAIIFVTPVVLVAAGLVIKRFAKLSWDDHLGFRGPRLGEGAAWSLGFLVLAIAQEVVTRFAGLESPAGSWRDKYDAADLLIRIVAVGLLYPLAEEFFFRGALLGAAAKRFGPTAGVLLSAAVFAAAHVQYQWQGMAFILADGLFFAICRFRTGSLYLVMLFHVAGNSFAVWERIFG